MLVNRFITQPVARDMSGFEVPPSSTLQHFSLNRVMIIKIILKILTGAKRREWGNEWEWSMIINDNPIPHSRPFPTFSTSKKITLPQAKSLPTRNLSDWNASTLFVVGSRHNWVQHLEDHPTTRWVCLENWAAGSAHGFFMETYGHK